MAIIPGSEPIEVARERVVSELGTHFANDHLTMDELERRLALVYRARSSSELAHLLADLPAAVAVASPVTVAPESDVRDTRHIVAVMGEVRRRGAWKVPRHLRLIAAMGEAHIDLRQATFPPGETTMTAFGLMSEITIIVPPGIGVEADGIALMGTVDSLAEQGLSVPGHPTLRIEGFALMASIHVKVRAVGEK